METKTNTALTNAAAPRERVAANSEFWYAVGPARFVPGGLWFHTYTADEMPEVLERVGGHVRFLSQLDVARLIAATGLHPDEIEA